MGVYINGMEMPKNPGAYSMKIRLFVKEDGTASVCGLKEYIPHEPLDVIPAPPHGRLIDADEFLHRAIGTKCFRGDYALMLEELVGESTTIIPAESPKEET